MYYDWFLASIGMVILVVAGCADGTSGVLPEDFSLKVWLEGGTRPSHQTAGE